MAPTEQMQTAMINRSIRTIKAELEYLTDASIISPQTLSSILQQIPAQTALHAPLSVGAVPTVQPVPGAPLPPSLPPSNSNNNNNNALPTRSSSFNNLAPPPPPPPSYQSAVQPVVTPSLCVVKAVYTYKGEDEGDLSFDVNDTIYVTEFTNAEWWKGRRDGSNKKEGIFPRSYVEVSPASKSVDNSGGNSVARQTGAATPTGVMPVDVANGNEGGPSKGQEMGKKFGKKLGNAAIFGAGASIGGSIVRGIF